MLISGCTVLAGRDDISQQIPPPSLKFSFIETLRNADSLKGERFNEVAFHTDPATSLQQPESVFADAFRVYATDMALGGRIFIFDRSDRSVTIIDRAKLKGSNGGSLVTPEGTNISPLNISGIAVDVNGIIFVSDSQQAKVFGYDRNGKLLVTFGKMGGLSRPSGLAIDNRRNRLYVADAHAHQVSVFSLVTNDPTGHKFDIGSSGPMSEQLKSPISLALDGNGNLLVLDSIRKKVQIYDPDGKFLRAFPLSDETPGGIIRPKGIAVDSLGYIYVSDIVNNNIQVFDQEGILLLIWGTTGIVAGNFMIPSGIFIDGQNTLYIADQTNGRIQHFSISVPQSYK